MSANSVILDKSLSFAARIVKQNPRADDICPYCLKLNSCGIEVKYLLRRGDIRLTAREILLMQSEILAVGKCS